MKKTHENVHDIRAFNRFYTVFIGLLDSHLLDSDYSLAEARILYEIHEGGQISASQIISNLNMDKGYMSRILKKFDKSGLIKKEASVSDARVSFLTLTEKGLKVFNTLDEASSQQIDNLINKLSPAEQSKLAGHMNEIVKLLNK